MKTQARKPRCSCLDMNLKQCNGNCPKLSLQGSPTPDTQICHSTIFRGASLIFPNRWKDSINHRINGGLLGNSRKVEIQLSLVTVQVSDTSGVTPLLLPCQLSWFTLQSLVLFWNAAAGPMSKSWSQPSCWKEVMLLIRNLKTSVEWIFKIQ